MTQIGSVYGGALYALARDEEIADQIREELYQVGEVFKEEPEYLRLLSAANIPRQERCALVDGAFRDKVHPYVLNFLKILTEKGYVRQFPECCKAYRMRYNADNNILPVTAVTAVALSEDQATRLKEKLEKLTEKTVELTNRMDPDVLGGVRLDFDGKSMDDTLAHRLESIRSLLNNTIL